MKKEQQNFYNETIEADREATDVYKMNSKDVDRLIEIAKYCKKNNIKLIFFSPPIMVDYMMRCQKILKY